MAGAVTLRRDHANSEAMGGPVEIEAQLHALMLAALGGDAAAYRRLLEALDRLLRRYFARRMSGAAANAVEDLAQETLMAVHSRRDTFDTAQPLTAWVYAIARYKLADYFRRQKLRNTLPIEDPDAFVAPDDEPGLTARMDVETLLQSVPERPRALIRDVKLGGASIAEAAERAGMTETAAKVSIHRGLKSLMTRVTGGAK